MPDLITADSMPVGQWTDKQFVSGEGDVYSLATRSISVAKGALNTMGADIARVFGQGFKVFLLCDARAKDGAARDIIRGLEESGFHIGAVFGEGDLLRDCGRVSRIAADVDDDVRLVIGAGGRDAAEGAKMVAGIKSLPLVITVIYPDYDGFLTPFCSLREDGYNELFVSQPPAMLIADLEVVWESDRAVIAAGLGIVMAKFLAVFDWQVASILNNEPYCPDIAAVAVAVTRKALLSAEGLIRGKKPSIAALTEALIMLGALAQMQGSPRLTGGGEELCVAVLDMISFREERERKFYGEEVFLAAQILFRVYPLLLSEHAKSALTPPDNAKRLEIITDLLGVSELNALKKIAPYMEASDYEVTQYKLKEFGQELKGAFGSYAEDFYKAVPVFKRIYADAGYSLKRYLSEDDLRAMISLAPDVGEKFTLLTVMKQMGILDEYL